MAAPLAFAPIEPVDLGSLPLVTPWMENVVGVPNLDTVVVLLLFIGSSCIDCALWLNTMITFYTRANMFGKQVEVVLIGAHRSFSEYSKIAFGNRSNPFLSLKYRKPEEQAILTQFGIKYDSTDGSFKPQLRIMEWLGASNRRETNAARVCSSIKTAFPFRKALDLAPMIQQVKNRADRLIQYSDSDFQAVDPDYTYSVFSNDWRYPPVDRVQTMRESCNYMSSETTDTLFALSKSRTEQKEFLSLLKRVSFSAGREKTELGVRITRFALNRKILDMVHLANLEYFNSFIDRLSMRAADSRPFPKLSSTPPGDPRFLIKIYYRTREWTVIREFFPQNFDILKSLVLFKVPDLDMATAKFFSDQLIPRLRLDESDETCPDGMTEKFATLNEMSPSDFDRVISHIRSKPVVPGALAKIRILVIDGQTRIDDPKPNTQKDAALDQISEMIRAAKSTGGPLPFAFSSVETLLSMVTVLKLSDIAEIQYEALRRIPVIKLHLQAVTEVLTERKRVQGTNSALSAEHHSSLGYSEALLKQLIAWFNERFFSWIPSSLACQADSTCSGSMELFMNSYGTVENHAAAHLSFLNDHILEDFTCNSCCGTFRLTRPIHDVSRLFRYAQGRCGEHAKAFALAAKAFGFDVRIVSGQFRPRHLTEEIFFGSSDLDHMWNEVFLKDRSRWVHVDVSASDEADVAAGAMGLAKSARFDSPQAYETSTGKLFSAVAASSDYVSVVTNRYLWSRESALFAKDVSTDDAIQDEVKALSAVVGRFQIAESVGPAIQRRSLIQHLISQDALPPKGWADADDPQAGKGEEFEGPSGIRIKILGGEIPDFMQRKKKTMFSSYGKLRGLDGSRWRVCMVEVVKNAKGGGGLFVSRIRFGYCVNEEASPSISSSTQVADGWFVDEEPFKSMPPLRTLTVVELNDHVARVDIQYNQQGLLSEFKPLLFSQDQTESREHVVGLYGAHRSTEGIEFAGLYLASPLL
jgi:hypothetical protein